MLAEAALDTMVAEQEHKHMAVVALAVVQTEVLQLLQKHLAALLIPAVVAVVAVIAAVKYQRAATAALALSSFDTHFN